MGNTSSSSQESRGSPWRVPSAGPLPISSQGVDDFHVGNVFIGSDGSADRGSPATSIYRELRGGGGSDVPDAIITDGSFSNYLDKSICIRSFDLSGNFNRAASTGAEGNDKGNKGKDKETATDDKVNHPKGDAPSPQPSDSSSQAKGDTPHVNGDALLGSGGGSNNGLLPSAVGSIRASKNTTTVILVDEGAELTVEAINFNGCRGIHPKINALLQSAWAAEELGHVWPHSAYLVTQVLVCRGAVTVFEIDETEGDTQFEVSLGAGNVPFLTAAIPILEGPGALAGAGAGAAAGGKTSSKHYSGYHVKKDAVVLYTVRYIHGVSLIGSSKPEIGHCDL